MNLQFTNVALYGGLVMHCEEEVHTLLVGLGVKIVWREASETTRDLQARLGANVSPEH